jgi:leader peptidase (prepilin peptidase)/N-methyltransferase
VIAPVIPILAGVFGLAIGSFLNVVVYRVPRGLSVVRPASACPGCGSEITARDNIPVLSWLLLRGRCRTCANPISARYPIVEALTGLAFVIVGLFFAPRIASAVNAADLVAAILTTVAFLYLAAISVALAAIDLDVHRLPNAIVLPAYVVGGVLLTASALVAGDPEALLRGIGGAAAYFVFYLVLALAKPGGMGMGDVKLAGVLGLFLGYLGLEQLIVGAFGAFLLGGLVGVVIILAQKGDRRTAIPFGPWMLAGAWLAVLAGEPLASLYLRLTGLGE